MASLLGRVFGLAPRPSLWKDTSAIREMLFSVERLQERARSLAIISIKWNGKSDKSGWICHLVAIANSLRSRTARSRAIRVSSGWLGHFRVEMSQQGGTGLKDHIQGPYLSNDLVQSS